jgi:acyl-CoA thioester hydrolase
MFKLKITPSFSDTDMLGHINNTVIPVWCETARKPIFEIFNPGLKKSGWNLIVARIEMDFISQIDFEPEIEVQTHIERIGNSSFTILQEIFQGEKKVAIVRTVMVHFNYQSNKAVHLPQEIRHKLVPLLVS